MAFELTTKKINPVCYESIVCTPTQYKEYYQKRKDTCPALEVSAKREGAND